MSMSDTIADFLTRVRNAYRSGHEDVQVKHSVLAEKVAGVMLAEGYLDDVSVVGEGCDKHIVVRVKYVNGKSVISGLERISKPGRRVYVGYKDIRPVVNGLGISILSTPAGVMSDVEARKKRTGGELICNMW